MLKSLQHLTWLSSDLSTVQVYVRLTVSDPLYIKHNFSLCCDDKVNSCREVSEVRVNLRKTHLPPLNVEDAGRTLGGHWADGVLRERTDEAASEETSSSPVVKLSAPLSFLLPSTLLTFCFSKLSSHISPPLLSSPLLSVFFPPVAPSGPLASLFPCPFLYLSFHILLSHLLCLSFCPSHISSKYN